MPMSYVNQFLEKAKFIILLMGIATRGIKRAFKTPSNWLWTFLQEYAAHSGHENLRKIYARLSKPQGTGKLVTKIF